MSSSLAGGRRFATPSARSVRDATRVLSAVTAEMLADIIEHLIERLDALEPDLNLEDDPDCCPAGDDGIHFGLRSTDRGAGDPDDTEDDDPAEDGGDDEPHDDRDLEEEGLPPPLEWVDLPPVARSGVVVPVRRLQAVRR